MDNREQIQRTLARRDELGPKNLENVLVQMLDAASMASYPPSKVAGYTPQPDAKVQKVNYFKIWEERILRDIDVMMDAVSTSGVAKDPYDAKCLVLASEYLQTGFMWLNRAVFQPQRVKLPEEQ